ncbi:hypothetical protein KC341_g15 [Hortaea werneckii]|nr:hypothetical protein KC341_g15 [Hortaea werneckii]
MHRHIVICREMVQCPFGHHHVEIGVPGKDLPVPVPSDREMRQTFIVFQLLVAKPAIVVLVEGRFVEVLVGLVLFDVLVMVVQSRPDLVEGGFPFVEPRKSVDIR